MIWYTVCAFADPMSKKHTQNTNKFNGMACNCNCNQSMNQSIERRNYDCPGITTQYPITRFKGGVSLKETPCMVLYICAGVLQPPPPNQF